MGGISRVNGGVIDTQGFYGYQPVFLKIAGTNVGRADLGGAGSAITERELTKSIRAILTKASIVYLGNVATNQYVVAVDGPTASTYNTANTDSSLTAAIKKAIDDLAFNGANTVTVTDISGLESGDLA